MSGDGRRGAGDHGAAAATATLARVEFDVSDDAFVRAPGPLVYRRLTDLGAWPDWWPDARVAPVGTPRGAELFALRLRERPCRRLDLVVHPHGWRLDTGFAYTVEGDLDGRGEFWLERDHGGTVVHHLLRCRVTRRGAGRHVARYRRCLRRGLWSFKDSVESEVRAAMGLTP